MRLHELYTECMGRVTVLYKKLPTDRIAIDTHACSGARGCADTHDPGPFFPQSVRRFSDSTEEKRGGELN